MKPNREPDYISSVGSYYWFDELVIYGLDGEARPMILEENSSLLRVNKSVARCEDCWRCKSKQDCERAYFKEEIQIAYREWKAKFLEKALGLEDYVEQD